MKLKEPTEKSKILVLFASKSDEAIYQKITKELKQAGISYTLRIASAHKTPELVEEILKTPYPYQAIISGAGLAAHLSGVIAAQTTSPVLGVPCQGAYEGLDAFLSIVQMPPGIPVLEVNGQEAAREAVKILSPKNRIVVTTGSSEGSTASNASNANTAADKAFKTLTEMKLPVQKGALGTNSQTVYLAFPKLGEPVEATDSLVIYCPTSQEETKAEDALLAMRAARFGLWVGVNRADNAAIAATEILGRKEELKTYRAQIAQKIYEADKEARTA